MPTGTRIQLAVLDMAGTTVADDGAVEDAFRAAAEAVGAPADHRMLQYVRDTMGESKITVFRALFGDEERAQAANRAFEQAYGKLVADGRAAPVNGAEAAIRQLREDGVRVALTTGFAPVTRNALLDALGWHDLVDLALSPADAGRGRPYPDLVLTALLRLGADGVRNLAVAGDTASDMRSGTAAGASLVAGVRTGAHGEDALREAGATHVLGSVAELPALIAGGAGR